MFETIKKMFKKEESLSEYLTKKNSYERWFAEKHQDALKKRYVKLLQDLNDLAETKRI